MMNVFHKSLRSKFQNVLQMTTSYDLEGSITFPLIPSTLTLKHNNIFGLTTWRHFSRYRFRNVVYEKIFGGTTFKNCWK